MTLPRGWDREATSEPLELRFFDVWVRNLMIENDVLVVNKIMNLCARGSALKVPQPPLYPVTGE